MALPTWLGQEFHLWNSFDSDAVLFMPLKIMKQARDESQEMHGILRTLFLREDIGV